MPQNMHNLTFNRLALANLDDLADMHDYLIHHVNQQQTDTSIAQIVVIRYLACLFQMDALNSELNAITHEEAIKRNRDQRSSHFFTRCEVEAKNNQERLIEATLQKYVAVQTLIPKPLQYPHVHIDQTYITKRYTNLNGLRADRFKDLLLHVEKQWTKTLDQWILRTLSSNDIYFYDVRTFIQNYHTIEIHNPFQVNHGDFRASQS